MGKHFGMLNYISDRRTTQVFQAQELTPKGDSKSLRRMWDAKSEKGQTWPLQGTENS